jgi:hypothetical protein
VAFGAKFGIFFFRFRDGVANFICLKKLTNLSQRALSSKASKFQWHRIKRLVTCTISENSIKPISVSLKEHRKKKKKKKKGKWKKINPVLKISIAPSKKKLSNKSREKLRNLEDQERVRVKERGRVEKER